MPDHLGDQAAVGVLGVLALRTGRWKSPAGPSESAAQHASMRQSVSIAEVFGPSDGVAV